MSSFSKVLDLLEDLDEDELLRVNDTVVAMVKHKRHNRNVTAKAKLSVGDTVTITIHNKKSHLNGQTVQATIDSIGRTKAKITTTTGEKFSTPCSNLTKFEQPQFNPLTGEFE